MVCYLSISPNDPPEKFASARTNFFVMALGIAYSSVVDILSDLKVISSGFITNPRMATSEMPKLHFSGLLQSPYS